MVWHEGNTQDVDELLDLDDGFAGLGLIRFSLEAIQSEGKRSLHIFAQIILLDTS